VASIDFPITTITRYILDKEVHKSWFKYLFLFFLSAGVFDTIEYVFFLGYPPQAKHYAEQIAKELGAVLKERKRARISELAKYDTVIYGGGIYVGRIAGSGFIRKVYRKLPDKHFVVFSVGFTPHSRVDVLEAARNNSLKGINIEKIDFFHFRGSMDYKKLIPSHASFRQKSIN
jgi:hypothetical protein